ncbi:MAG: hypothetical protein AB8B69_08695, partial [Chitinophagales bacterium]
MNQQQLIEQIKKAFVKCVESNCLEIIDKERIEIFDDEIEKRCFIRQDESQPVHFTILNPSQKEIAFLAIDKCLFSDDDRWAKCDFVVFDDQTFCFVEVKQAKANQRKKRRIKAIGQLKATVKVFVENIDFESYELEAHICL